MLQRTNIDRMNSLETSPAPFTYESLLRLGNVSLPTGSFVSLKVYTEPEYRVPYRIHSLESDGTINISDATGRVCIYWKTFPTTATQLGDSPYISSLLFNTNHVIAGHVCCTRTAMDSIRRVIDGLQGTMILSADSFVMIPQCHIPMMTGAARAVSVNGTYLTGDVSIAKPAHITGDSPKVQVLTDYTSEILTASLIPTTKVLAEEAVQNALCAVRVNGGTYSCVNLDGSGKNIIIKSAVASNLRVVREDGNITLKGVTDA